MFNFTDAERVKQKASIQIEGLSGKGKSGLALAIAKGLTQGNWEKIYCIDTENKSLPLYVGLPLPNGEKYGKFKICQITPDMGYKPSNYLAAREVAIKAGAQVVIKDSTSHAWQYKGGVLDLVTKAKNSNKRYQSDSYAAWSDPEVAAEKIKLLDLLRDERVHVITTTRVKEKMEYDTSGEKTKLVSLGEQQIQQSELKYEPDLVLHMESPGSSTVYPTARVIKTRYGIFELGQEYTFTPELIEQLRVYLEEGVDPEALLEEQRKEYVLAVNKVLTEKKAAQMMWKVLKQEAGYADDKLEDLPLSFLKQAYITITQ